MPKAGDNIPTFTKGEPVSARKLNELGNVVRRSLGAPGMFATGAFTAIRRMGGGGGAAVSYVAITDTIEGAEWEDDVKTDAEITVYPFDAAGRISESRTATVFVGGELDTPLTVASGKFRVGVVVGRDLISIFCKEWELPDEWEGT